MPRHYDFVPQVSTIPDFWLDHLQEWLANYVSGNFKLELASSTSVRVVAGATNDQIGIGIEGKWRYNVATVTATHPGGAADTYDVWVTAADNNFTGTPPNVDLTVYTFALEVRAQGSPPTTAIKRKVGTVVWSGTEITKVTQTVGSVGGGGGNTAYSTSIGDGTSTSYTVTHNFNTRNVSVTVREGTSPYSLVFPEVRITDLNTVTVIFDGPAPASGAYFVTVIADGSVPATGGVGTYVATVGDGAAVAFALTHSLNTRDAHVTVRQAASPYAEVEAEVEHTDANTVTVRFTVAPTAGQYVVFVSTAQNREGAASVHAAGHAPGASDALTQNTVGLAGRVNTDGTIAGGAGFTVVKNGTGDYTVTFTAAFAAIPVVTGNVLSTTTFGSVAIHTVAVGSVRLTTWNAAGAATDLPFHFDARPVS